MSNSASAICRVRSTFRCKRSLNALTRSTTKPPTVVICHHGLRSMQVAFIWNSSVLPICTICKGGIDAWARQIEPSMPRY